MTDSIQNFLLKHTKFLQKLINDNLAKRPGFIGKLGKWFMIGPRNYSRHSIDKIWRLISFAYLWTIQRASTVRPITQRLFDYRSGKYNLLSPILIVFMSIGLIGQFKAKYFHEKLFFNEQDMPQYYKKKYGIDIPPSLLNNRVSAHYIEINQIVTDVMIKKFLEKQEEILAEREKLTDQEKKTKYITNKKYVYEPMKEDPPETKNLSIIEYITK